MTAFTSAVAALFRDPNLSAAATYQATPDAPAPLPAPVAVRVMTRRPDMTESFGSARAWSETTLVDLPVASVAAPLRGDRITLDGVAYRIQSEPRRDRERLVWSLDLAPEQ